jgi:hypothetical protein
VIDLRINRFEAAERDRIKNYSGFGRRPPPEKPNPKEKPPWTMG